MVKMMSTSTTSRLARVKQEFQQRGFGGVTSWGARWLYWNVGLYRGTELATNLRREYKYNKRVKRYGIQDPIALFQMGKVGSSTLSASLAQLDFDVPVVTCHTLTDFDAQAEFIKTHAVDPTQPLQVIDRNRQIHNLLFSGRWKKFNVISMVRLPIRRTVSAFFEHWSTTNPEFQTRNAAGAESVEFLVDEFLNHYFHNTADAWFDAQMRPVFDIDVFQEPFDHARGYQIYQNNTVRLLVLRLEDLRRVVTPAMQEFLAIPDFTLTAANISETKGYGEIYKQFVERARLPRAYIEQMRNTRYARYFYSEQELDADARFWLRE
ncbi:MAG: hypothetical protein B6D41_09465 [Chloroflexi bacterium UTCFX4]|nr:MAG: hypothetical protein B6D41_09465 [Chloroflexi bacterium UTCFX4]